MTSRWCSTPMTRRTPPSLLPSEPNSLYLLKKMRDSEVVFSQLDNEKKALFTRAKSKEVSSFVQNEAVRKCLSDAEIKRALGSGRILRACWVLVWKLVPPEDQDEARKDAMTNPSTVHTKDGLRKAKARIALLGYEHPEIGSPSHQRPKPLHQCNQCLREIRLDVGRARPGNGMGQLLPQEDCRWIYIVHYAALVQNLLWEEGVCGFGPVNMRKILQGILASLA